MTYYGEDKSSAPPPDRGELSYHPLRQRSSYQGKTPAGGVPRSSCNGSYVGKGRYATISSFSLTYLNGSPLSTMAVSRYVTAMLVTGEITIL